MRQGPATAWPVHSLQKFCNTLPFSKPFFFNVFDDLLTLIFCVHGILGHNRKDFLSIFLDQFIIVAINIFQEPISPLMNSSSHYILPFSRYLELIFFMHLSKLVLSNKTRRKTVRDGFQYFRALRIHQNQQIALLYLSDCSL